MLDIGQVMVDEKEVIDIIEFNIDSKEKLKLFIAYNKASLTLVLC